MADKPEHGKRKTPRQHKKLGKLLAENVPVGQALVEAGWSELQAKKGWGAVPDRVIATLPPKMQRLVNLGKTDKETRRHLIRGRLVDNIQKGKDGGSMSCKILGSDSELSMWQPENMQGLIILQTPQRLSDPATLKKMLEAEE
jgi:hypothetical protein